MNIREKCARAICVDKGINPNQIGLGSGHIGGMPKDSKYPLWQAWLSTVDSVLKELDK